MGFYEDFVNGLKGSIGEGKAFEKNVDLAEFLGKPPAYTHRLISGDRGKTLESVGKLLDKLGAKLVFPGDPAPNQSAGAEDLTGKVRELEKQVDELKEYKAKYEAARELVAIMSGNKPQPQQLTLPEPEAKRKIA